MCYSRKTRGFTLIELLVVIAIIAILAAILFPVFGEARKRGQMANCISNLRQLTTAFQTYVDNNHGRMPRLYPRISGENPLTPQNWCGAVYLNGYGVRADIEQGTLFPYAKTAKVYLCNSDRGVKAKAVTGQPRDYPLSYSANEWLDWANVDASARKPSTLMLLMHESRDTINDGYMSWSNPTQDMPSKVHYEGSTISFVDGHAKYLSHDELMNRRGTGEWSLKGK